jgi:flagellin
MRINNNLFAINAQRNLNKTNTVLAKSNERLSSGLRINRAADDAAGLVISQNLRSQVSGNKVASRNALDGVSFVQTAEGALDEVATMLNRMKDLAIQSANGTADATQRTAMQAEFAQLVTEIGSIGTNTRFASLTVFAAAAVTFQVGNVAADTLAVTVGVLTSASLTINNAGVGTLASATAAIALLDTAIGAVSTTRGTLGATQNRLESRINYLALATENLQAAESRIRDVDMADEMVTYTRWQILQQSGTSMLAQANQLPSSVLQLLR